MDTAFQLGELSPTAFASALDKLRRRCGCLGRGLPGDRVGLHDLVVSLCDRVRSADRVGIPGPRLAGELGLEGTRSLRLLLAFARVAYGLREVVGVPGSGYYWGPADPEVYHSMAGHARRMGRDWMFLGVIYGEGSAEASMAQLVLDFASTAHQRAASGLVAPGGTGADDDLADLAERGQVSMGAVLDEIVTFMRSHPAVYGEDLRRLSAAHGEALVSREALAKIHAQIVGLAAQVSGLAG